MTARRAHLPRAARFGVLLLLAGCIGSPTFFGGLGGGTPATGGGAMAGGSGHAGGQGGGSSGGSGGSFGFGGGSGMTGGFGGSGGMGAGLPDASSPLVSGPSRSSTIALALNHGFFAAVNPDVPAIIIGWLTPQAPLVQRTDVFMPGEEPSSIAIDASETTGVVALRRSNRVAKVTFAPAAPTVVASMSACSEPTGVALTPDGQWAVVACFGEPLAVLLNFTTQTRVPVLLPGVARAVSLSADGQHAYLPMFFGIPTAEGSDQGRLGEVAEISVPSGQAGRLFTLSPVSDTRMGPLLADGGMGANVGCAPNQLAAIVVTGQFAFVPHTCVSPAGPATSTSSLFSVVSVIDLSSGQEVLQPPFVPTVLNAPTAPWFSNTSMAGLVDVDFWPGRSSVYVLAQGANRIAVLSPAQPFMPMPEAMGTYSVDGCPYEMPGCALGADLQGVPMSVRSTPTGLLVNDRTARAILHIDFGGKVDSSPYDMPATGADRDVRDGERLFFTARGRWSRNEVGSCGSCHPDGLSDNVTWVFGSGPRQTPPLDGTFAKADAGDHRAQNWTANFDEIYDVEGVVRNVLGGRGALVADGGAIGESVISLSRGIVLDGVTTRNDNLSGSSRTVDVELSELHDWGLIEKYIQTIRSPNAPFATDPSAVTRGRAQFAAGGCYACHAGPKWSSSYVPYAPSPAKNGSLVGDNGQPAAPTGLRTQARDGGQLLPFNRDTLKVAVELVPNPDGGAALTVGPERITCVLRDVGTFDATDPLERKSDGTRAQGELGFNPPSLLGLARSAPYLHHGAATTLSDLFTNARYQAHLKAGMPNYTPSPSDVVDLVTFLRSIDESSLPFAANPAFDLCAGY